MSPNHPDCTGMAQHAMVLGPSQHVSSNSPLTSPNGEFANSTVQPVSAQRSPQPKSACLAPRATAIQQAGFSDELQPELSLSQSGSFLSDGVRRIRRTSGLPL